MGYCFGNIHCFKVNMFTVPRELKIEFLLHFDFFNDPDISI